MGLAAKMQPEAAAGQLSGGSLAVAPEVEARQETILAAIPEDHAIIELAKTVEDQATTAKNIESLPNELLTNIFGYFDTPKPSDSTLHDEPTFEVSDSDVTDLKAISCVSRRWRRATMPALFKYARFIVAEPETNKPVLNEIMAPFFDFVEGNSLLRIISSFTFIVHNKEITNTSDGDHGLYAFSTFWYSLFEIIDPVDLLIVAPPEALGSLTACHIYMEDAWCFSDCPCHYLRLSRSPTDYVDSPPLKGLTQNEALAKGASPGISAANDATTDVATRPAEVVNNARHASFNQPTDGKSENHEPSTSQTEAVSSSSTQPRGSGHVETSALFDVRLWTALLLNEGSSIRAYATYEFWLRQPPSILPDLCGTEVPARKPFISQTIREMNYIALFPMQSHLAALVDKLPRIDRLYMQLVPRTDVLDDEVRMANVEHTDLWMERNNCYAHVMRELFGAPPTLNYKFLEEFESGDAADTDAWLMAVEYVKRAGNGWNVVGDGIFARNREDLPPENPEGGIEENATFEGALILWKWNGLTKLPISALPLYDRPFGIGF